MAQVPLAEAARGLGLHPLNLMVKLRPVVGGLTDCWPTVEDGFIATIRQLDGLETRIPSKGDSRKLDLPLPSSPVRDAHSAAERKIVEKLYRKKMWPNHPVAPESIQKLCQGFQSGELDDAIENLVRKGLLIKGDGHRGPYSLNPPKKGEIEKIAQAEINASGE